MVFRQGILASRSGIGLAYFSVATPTVLAETFKPPTLSPPTFVLLTIVLKPSPPLLSAWKA